MSLPMDHFLFVFILIRLTLGFHFERMIDHLRLPSLANSSDPLIREFYFVEYNESLYYHTYSRADLVRNGV